MLAFKLIVASLSMQLYVYLFKKTVVYRTPVNKQNYSKEFLVFSIDWFHYTVKTLEMSDMKICLEIVLEASEQ